jgi:hypothetical protein
MRIRMKVTMSGTRNGEDWPPAGETVDLPTGEAQHLVASGIAEEIDTAPEVETATVPDTAEKRVRKAAAKKPDTK